MISCGIVYIFLPAYTRMQDKEAENEAYQRRIQHLEEENRRLRLEQKLLEEDPVYLEKVARERMGLVREGEIIYRIPQAVLNNRQTDTR